MLGRYYVAREPGPAFPRAGIWLPERRGLPKQNDVSGGYDERIEALGDLGWAPHSPPFAEGSRSPGPGSTQIGEADAAAGAGQHTGADPGAAVEASAPLEVTAVRATGRWLQRAGAGRDRTAD